ncbi:MAG: TAXI family TRAP transporter solute-binding subunit [Leucobacter sp.]|nr:TAXI family TRAP transporter solute-binding subunit [Leucobacter sp.]
MTACTAGNDAGRPTYQIAGGDPSGVYFNYAAGLAAAANDSGSARFEVAETQGSVDNLRRVGSGEAIVGFAQGDTTVDAVRGEGNFDSPLPVRAVARVYDEYVHLVVPADAAPRSVADLAGGIVSLGAENSGVQVIALRVLDAAGVPVESVTNLGLGLEESIAAMQRGEIEAFFWVGGLPTPGIEQLQQTMPIRLLSIDADLVEQVNANHAGVYQLADIPVGFYGLDGTTVTMTVPNYLITAENAADELVSGLLRELFDAQADIAQQVPAASYLDRRQAIFTGPIELHPAAAQYYVDSRR